MENLKIVRGNDFYLMVPVRRIVFANDEYGDKVRLEERVELNDCSVLAVCLIDENEHRLPLSFTVTDGDDSELTVKVRGREILCGWYGLEVKGMLGGRHWRSYERKVFKIVENNGKSYVDGDMYAGERSYQVDTMWMLYAAPSYPHLFLDPEKMTLNMVGTIENGETYLDENGKLCLRVSD